MAHLFSKIVLKDALKNISIADMESKITILQEWNAMYQKGELQKKKETAFEATYSEKLFGAILGYSDVSGGVYTREKHPKNQSNGQTCDIGLGYYSAGKNETQAVVELKDAGTSIDRPQQREGNMTPIQQGFKYKPLYNSRWVIVSNYYELRLYRDTYQDYEVWTLSDLVNPANDYEKFRTFYFLLRAESLIAQTGESETEKLLAKVRIEQETITKKFYKEYSDLRTELMRDIWRKNTILKNTSVIQIAQNIIDRIVFIHFCEDRGLLPQNKLTENLQIARQAGFDSWEVLQKYFNQVDSGSTEIGIPDGYNGGLFRENNEVLRNLKISDEIITKFIELGRYDFSDEGGQLSVEILGHIFEQSISDLETIRTKIQNQGKENIEEEKKVSKRKKDGIFYTPAYIVDYIVRNSLGKYLEEHEERIKEQYKLKGDITEKNYRKRELEAYIEYQKILHTVKVLDPACGSGAFLVRVFDFLLAENLRVDKILGGNITNEMSLTDKDPSAFFGGILKNNIYGVDLNEESVEITKLSLWLKSAVRGKKLETLDNNIKCGNSLIDDPVVAGDKAFNWNTEFADIMASGGFDVIVGNPPYGAKLDEKSKDYCKMFFENVHTRTVETFNYFISRSLGALKNNGELGFIVPNNILFQNEFEKARKFLLTKNQIHTVINLGDSVFEDATVPSCIILVRKSQNKNFTILYGDCRFTEQKNNLNTPIIYTNTELQNVPGIVFGSNPGVQKIFEKVEKLSYKIDDIAEEVASGISTGGDAIFRMPEDKAKELGLEEDLLRKCLVGGDIGRYYNHHDGNVLIYSTKNSNTDKLPKTFSYLQNFEQKLSQKRETMKGMIPYWSLHWPRYPGLFEGEKIILRQTADSIIATYDPDSFYTVDSILIIKLNPNIDIAYKFVVSILNTSLTTFLYKSLTQEEGRTFAQVKSVNVRKLFVPRISPSEQQPFIEKADLMLSLNRDFQEKSGSFLKNISAKYRVSRTTRKLEKWWELDFAELLKETKISISLTEQEELMQYFETRRAEVRAIDTEIRKTDTEIDSMVFDLYGLTEEERRVVLNS